MCDSVQQKLGHTIVLETRLGSRYTIVQGRGDEMNTVASFIRPFIRLFSFVFVQRTTRRNFTVVGKKAKGYRRQKEPSIKGVDFLRAVGVF